MIMSNLKQIEIVKALQYLYKAEYQIDDGYHNHEIADIIKIKNKLFNELTIENKHKFQNWATKYQKEKRELE